MVAVFIGCSATIVQDGAASEVDSGFKFSTFPEFFGIIFFGMEGNLN